MERVNKKSRKSTNRSTSTKQYNSAISNSLAATEIVIQMIYMVDSYDELLKLNASVSNILHRKEIEEFFFSPEGGIKWLPTKNVKKIEKL